MLNLSKQSPEVLIIWSFPVKWKSIGDTVISRHGIATQSWKGCTEKEEQEEEWREMGKPTVHEITVGWMRK